MSTGYSPDSAAVNTAPPSLYTLASANIAAGASVASEATYVHNAGASASADCTVTSGSTRFTLGEAHPVGSVWINPRQTKITKALAAGGATAKIIASVIRFITDAAVSFQTTASLQVIPADELGEGDVTSVATVTGAATRVQFGRTPVALCTGQVSATAEVTRLVEANVSGDAQFYITAGINGVYECFIDFNGVGSLAIQNAGLRIALGDVDVIAFSASSQGKGTIVQFARAVTFANATTVIPDGTLTTSPGLPFLGTASVVADAIRGLPCDADIVTSCTTSASANQEFTARCDVLAPVVIAPVANRFTFDAPTISGTAAIEAVGVRVKLGVVALSDGAEVTAESTVNFSAAANINCPATVVTDARIALRGEANVSATADSTFSGVVTKFPVSALSTQAVVSADSTRFLLPTANVPATATVSSLGVRLIPAELDVAATGELVSDPLVTRFVDSDIVGVALIEADSVANPASFDPPERTFVRPPAQFDFVKPEQEFVFEKVA